MFVLKVCVTLKLTRVAGKTLVRVSLSPGKGRWQTLPQYLVSTIQQETHLVVICFLFHLSHCCFCFLYLFDFLGAFLLIASSVCLHGRDSVVTVKYVAGHVMYTSGRGFMYSANLEYSIDKLAALGCQMRYFFQVYKP